MTLRIPGWDIRITGVNAHDVSSVAVSVASAIIQRQESRPAELPAWTNDGAHDVEIARCVLEGDHFINQIASAASNELKRSANQRYLSFAAAVVEGKPSMDGFLAAAEALYLHLKNDHHLRYEFERRFDEATGRQFIRLPQHVQKENRGTCIDLVLLFLSCLANVKLWPVYIQVRLQNGSQVADHAIAGTWLEEPAYDRPALIGERCFCSLLLAERILVLDCTGFAEGYPGRQYKTSFTEARQEAQRLIEQHRLGFVVDIRKAWETGVQPV
jgi:hypothetical protein